MRIVDKVVSIGNEIFKQYASFRAKLNNAAREAVLGNAMQRKSIVFQETPEVTPSPPDMKLGENIKRIYPDKWAQDAILEAWKTGRVVVRSRPHTNDKSQDS